MDQPPPTPATTPPGAEGPQPSALDAELRRLSVPPWVQLVGLPLAVFFAWLFATAASHAVIVFLIATLISLLLNPIVRRLVGRGVPRGISVLMVFSSFSFVIVLLSFGLVNVTVDQATELRQNLPELTERAEVKVDEFQGWLDARGAEVDLRDQGVSFLTQLEEKSSDLSGEALSFGREFVSTVAEAAFNVILVVVITVYMLLDAPRIGRFVSGMLPPESGVSTLFPRLERALHNYIRGQTLASTVMGVSATVGLWIIGATGVWPAATDLAIVFGVIVAITEFAPSIGPVLGSIPPIVGAMFDGLVPTLTVAIFFLLLHQIEGHIVIPKLMGAAIAVHPLIVIFGIIAGAQIMGAGGIILVLPLLAVGREIVIFLRERFAFGSWQATPHLAAALADGAAEGATMGVAMADGGLTPAPMGERVRSASARLRDRAKAATRRRRDGDNS